jgi:hypothetical protein
MVQAALFNRIGAAWSAGAGAPVLVCSICTFSSTNSDVARKTGVWSWANGAIAASRRAGTVNLITDCYAPRSGCDAAGEQESLTDESGHR